MTRAKLHLVTQSPEVKAFDPCRHVPIRADRWRFASGIEWRRYPDHERLVLQTKERAAMLEPSR